MGVTLLISLASMATCPDREQVTTEATAATIDADLFLARTRLTQLERAFACGPQASPDQLARLWLIEGALSVFAGDTAGADEAFAAAARLSPGLWIEDLGMVLRTHYEHAPRQVHGTGVVDLQLPLDGWTVSIDGQTTLVPTEVASGLHLVQVGPDPEHMAFAQMVHVLTGSQTLIDTGLVPPDDVPAPPPSSPPPSAVPPPRWTVDWLGAVGLGLGSGQRSGAASGPNLAVPMELGMQLLDEPVWGRIMVGGAPRIGGHYVHAGGRGVTTSPSTIGGQVAGGVRHDVLAAGLLAALHWPCRAGFRAVGSGRLGDGPLSVEARAGVDVTTGPAEPGVEILIVVEPGRE